MEIPTRAKGRPLPLNALRGRQAPISRSVCESDVVARPPHVTSQSPYTARRPRDLWAERRLLGEPRHACKPGDSRRCEAAATALPPAIPLAPACR